MGKARRDNPDICEEWVKLVEITWDELGSS